MLIIIVYSIYYNFFFSYTFIFFFLLNVEISKLLKNYSRKKNKNWFVKSTGYY